MPALEAAPALPPLADLIATLDTAREDGDHLDYAIAWVEVCRQADLSTWIVWDQTHTPTDEPAIQIGARLDGVDRREHHESVIAHLRAAPDGEPRKAVVRELIRRGQFGDDRAAPAWEVKAVVRGLLATGGRWLLPPDRLRDHPGPVEPAPDTKAFLRGDWSEAHSCAAAAAYRLITRRHAQRQLVRILRRLGKQTDNGWFVLGGNQ